MKIFPDISTLSLVRTLYLVLLSCGLCSCHSSDLQFEPIEDGRQIRGDFSRYTHTDSVLEVVENYTSLHARLDTLLFLADYLANYDDRAALKYAQKANEIAKKKKHRKARAISQYYLAMLEGRQEAVGEGIDPAMVNARISYRLFEKEGDTQWMIRVNNLIGNFFFRKSEYDSAEFHFYRSLQLVEKGNLIEKDSLTRRGAVYHELGNVMAKRMRQADLSDSTRTNLRLKAENLYQDAIILYQLADYVPALLRLKRDMGIFYLNLRDFPRSEQFFQESLESTIASADHNNQVKLYQHLGFLYIRRYQQDKSNDSLFQTALDFYHQSLAMQSENFYESYLRIGNLYHIRDAGSEPVHNQRPYVDSALVYYAKALAEAEKEGAFHRMQNITRNVSQLCDRKAGLDGPDCEELLGTPVYAFLNEKYEGIVDSMDTQIRSSETKFRIFEQEMLKESASRERLIQLLISITILAILGIIFFAVYQFQQRKRLEARMEALRAQINPHFVSNSLNAIENLVNQNQREAAAKYLIHFSRFSRRILNGSRNANTALHDELEMLRHFLALEQLRFRDKLSYDIQVEEGLNTRLIVLPAMIMQPYVENAIWHGIKPKTDAGFLQIKVEMEGNQLICTIEDNGIGREKSRQLRAKSVLNRKSMGMEISQERLKVMGKVKGTHVEIIDLYDENGIAKGTRVLLRIPLKYKKEKTT